MRSDRYKLCDVDHPSLPDLVRELYRLRYATGTPSRTEKERYGEQDQQPESTDQRVGGTGGGTGEQDRRHGGQGQRAARGRQTSSQEQR